MRILLVHNYYQEPGGEDRVFESEAQLLEANGHEVRRYTAHNDLLKTRPAVAAARDTLWNGSVARELATVCRSERPDVVHFHNTFPLISPAAYHAVRSAGVPVVQTLHNYRTVCPAATFLRDGRACESCLGRTVAWPSVVHGCYRGRAGSAVVTTMLTTHRLLQSWRQVSLYIALTEFARRKYVEGGLPADRLTVKPNFVRSDPEVGTHRGGYALFVGRLSSEKGIEVLLDAWQKLETPFPLKIVGDGPLSGLLAEPREGIEWLGRQTAGDVVSLMKGASFLVSPSQCYETFGLTIAEAFATGLPVIASRLGAAAELVTDGRTGLHFDSIDAVDLAGKVSWAARHPEAIAGMAEAARREYLEKYTADRNYRMLTEIYQRVITAAN